MPKLKTRVSVISGLLGLAGLTALPAQVALAEDGGIEEVIVTARRKEENLQSVPISVSVLSGEQLASKGVTDMLSLGNHIPSVKIQGAELNPKRLSVGIRGLRANSSLISTDQAVGVYFAEGGVFHPYGMSQSFFDIQSVQVVKGPQGTLFGKNTTGGALLIEPNKPSFDGLDGYAKVGVGNFDMRKFEGVINVPLNDVAAVRASYSQNERDGYTRVLRSGQMLDSVDDRALRLQLTVKPTANITSNTMIDLVQDNGSPNDPQLVGVIPSNGIAAFVPPLQLALAAQQARGPRVIDTMIGTGIVNFGGVPPTSAGLDTFDPARCPTGTGVGKPFCRDNHVPKQKVDVKGFLNNTAIDLGGVTLKNILSYRQTFYHTDMSESVPSSIFNAGIQSMFEVDVHQASDELQLSGKALDDKLDWITGAYFSKEAGRDKSWAYQFAYGNGAVPAAGIPAGLGLGWTNSGGRVVNLSKAIFAQGDYKFNDQWKLTAGVRKTWDDRSATSLGRSAGGRLCASFNPATGFTTAQTTQVPNCYDLSMEHKWSAPTWNLSLAYQADPDTMLYGTMRKGYNTGGFSVRAVQAKKFIYDPEVVRDIELGVKADGHLAGMPVRTNAAIFNSDYTNQQLQTIDTTLVPGTIITGTANVGKSRIYGGEFEFTILPTHALEFGLFASYVKAQYLQYPTQNPAGALVDIHDIAWGANGGNTGIPHWQGGLTGKYTMSLEDKGTLVLSADVTLRQHTVTSNDLIRTKYPYLAPQLIEPGYGVLNLRADWKRIWGNPLDLAFFVNNAGDKTYITGGAVVVGAMAATYAPPRMFGAELTYHFGEGAKAKD